MQKQKMIPAMSFDLITSELDNHPFVRTISTMQWTWSIGLNGRC